MTKQWLAHVKKMIHSHPGQSFSLILKKANKTYKKKSGSANKKKKSRKKNKTKNKSRGKKNKKRKKKR